MEVASPGDKGTDTEGALRLLGFCTLVWGPDSPGDVTQVKRCMLAQLEEQVGDRLQLWNSV